MGDRKETRERGEIKGNKMERERGRKKREQKKERWRKRTKRK